MTSDSMTNLKENAHRSFSITDEESTSYSTSRRKPGILDPDLASYYLDDNDDFYKENQYQKGGKVKRSIPSKSKPSAILESVSVSVYNKAVLH